MKKQPILLLIMSNAFSLYPNNNPKVKPIELEVGAFCGDECQTKVFYYPI